MPIESKRERERTGSGRVVFSGGTLPWSVGVYEVCFRLLPPLGTSWHHLNLADTRSQIRYHHDGKYNVLAHDGPLEIYAARPTTRDFASVRGALARLG